MASQCHNANFVESLSLVELVPRATRSCSWSLSCSNKNAFAFSQLAHGTASPHISLHRATKVESGDISRYVGRYCTYDRTYHVKQGLA